MKRFLPILLLLTAPAWAVTDDEVHNACQAHLNISMSSSDRAVSKPGYQPGWEKCAAFEATYQAALAAKAAAVKAQAEADNAARDAAAKARINQ